MIVYFWIIKEDVVSIFYLVVILFIFYQLDATNDENIEFNEYMDNLILLIYQEISINILKQNIFI